MFLLTIFNFSPFLSPFHEQYQDCDSILKLHKLSNTKLSSFSVGSFFYKTCNLKNSNNIIESIKEINFLIDKDIKYYIPNISNEIKKSLELINEN